MVRVKVTFLFLLILLMNSNAQITLEFSERRGFYDEAFALSIEASQTSAIIMYTLDGEEPSLTQGSMYSGPIQVNTTTVLRAIAYEVGVDTSKVYTHSYLYLQDVVRQPSSVEGWPNNSYSVGGSGEAVHDYEMDPAIVDSPLYSADIIQGLKDIPSLSIVMPYSDFWEMYDGDAEKKTSVELLYAEDESENQQDDCGIEPHSHFRLKRSMRLSFKKEYGNAMWSSGIFRNAAVGGENAVDELDRVVLRGGNNRAWSRNWNEDRTAFTRDEWYRQSQIAASGLGSHGTFVHLYVNGLYWGLYNPVERPDESFTSSYLGGEKEDWFAVSHGGDQGGDPGRYDYLTGELINKDLTDSVNYEELQQFLDIPHFADYLIVTWMTGVQDWPRNNWWGGVRNDSTGQFKYFGWDNEWSWDVTRNANNGAWVHPDFRRNDTDGQRSALFFNKTKVNQDFMMAFADRVYKLCFNNGALTDENSRLRWAMLNDNIRNAVVAESARWGDSLEDGETRTRDEHWQNEVDRLDGLMNGNVRRLMDALLEEEYYPSIDPPLFNNIGNSIEIQEVSLAKGEEIDLVNPNAAGEIYYTIDGTDPRLAGGQISSAALLYEGEKLLVENAFRLQARIRVGEVWTALHCLNVFVQSDFESIKLTEIMYHPPDLDALEGTELEFLEIKNTSTAVAIDISGLQITDGVEYVFPTGTIMEPQSFLVLASNAEALVQKCPELDVFGEYEGQLSNGGEQIEFTSFDGEIIILVEYDDSEPWPAEADGLGHSLVPIVTNPDHDQSDHTHWMLSEDNTCGSPGMDENIISSSISNSHRKHYTNIHPNPGLTGSEIVIRSTSVIQNVDLYNIEGNRVSTTVVSRQEKEVVFDSPSHAGIYFIHIAYQSGFSEYRSIIVL